MASTTDCATGSAFLGHNAVTRRAHPRRRTRPGAPNNRVMQTDQGVWPQTAQSMKFRDVVIFSGHRFKVPQGIQRIDTRATHGWQVRYGGTKLYSDHTNDGSGAATSLQLAQKDLLRRIATLPAPSMLQKQPSGNKASGLPVGVSGPIVRQRAGSTVRSCSLSVLLPRYGQPPRCNSIYIGTENTYTIERFEAAVDRAVAMRREAELVYEQAATKARRAGAKLLRDVMAGKVPMPKARPAKKAAPTPATKVKATRKPRKAA